MLVNRGHTVERSANDITEFEMNNTIGRGARIFRDQRGSASCPALAYLPADFKPVEVPRERPAQHICKFGERRQDIPGMTMRKDEPRIGIDIAKGVQREDMIGRFQYPTSRSVPVLQMLQEPPVKPVCGGMTDIVEPTPVGGNGVRRVETQASEHMSRNLCTFLWRVCGEWVKALEFRSQFPEDRQLSIDHARPAPGTSRAAVWCGGGIDRLPGAGDVVGVILRKQTVQKRRTAARQSGDENRAIDCLLQDRGSPLLRVAQQEQVRQKPQRVPPCREAAKDGEICLLLVACQQYLKRFLEAGVAEIGQSGGALRQFHQFRAGERPARSAQHKGNPIHAIDNLWDHVRLCPAEWCG